MKPVRLLTILSLLAMAAADCVPHQIRPVSRIDPTPLLGMVNERRSILENGLSGILETRFKQGRRRYGGEAYVIAFPDGPFRLEIPGPMGSTMMVMVNDGHEVTVYYPDKDSAYISRTGSVSINPHLPFPLPVETGMLPALLAGTVPEGETLSKVEAHLLESGERRLWMKAGESGLEFTFLFTKGQGTDLRLISARGNGLALEIATLESPPYLPQHFTLTLKDTVMKGDWERAAIFRGDRTVLNLTIPESASVTDLRDRH